MSIEKTFDCKSSALSSWNLQEYIATLTSANACLLFENVSCVTELFSSLSEIQQNIVSRLMVLGNEHGNNIGEKAMNIWIPTSKSELENSLRKLRSLKIIKTNVLDSSSQKNLPESISVQYQLNPIFQKTLTKFIFEGAMSTDFEIPKKIPEIKISYLDLTRFIRRQWSNILNIIVELSGTKKFSKNGVNDLAKFKLASTDTIKVLDSIKLITWSPVKDFNRSSLSSKAIRTQIDNEIISQEVNEQLFDGFEYDERLGFQIDPNELDIYNEMKNGVIENDLNSEEEYLPTNIKKIKPKKPALNSKLFQTKTKVDKIFEQKLAPKAFCWLLCDTCNQLLILLNGFIKLMEAESNEKYEEDKFSQVKTEKVLNSNISTVISLILRISSSKIGQPISINKKMSNDILIRFILFAYDLGLVYIDESLIESNICSSLIRFKAPQVSDIEIFYTTPFSLLIGSEGLKLQSLYSVFKVGDSFLQECNSENIQNLLLPSHFYFNEELWHKLTFETKNLKLHQPNCLNIDSTHIEAGIIVQSNFRIYCYTASPLQAKILRHLCQVKVRGPNIICGILSRKGLLSAYSMGVSAEQILRFFSSNAHPMILRRFMLEGASIIPTNVETQLRLWEKDKNRLKISFASTFSNWGTTPSDIQLYNQTVLYAKSKETLLYSTPIDFIEKEINTGSVELQKKIILIIKQEYEDDIKTFIRTKREVNNR